MDILFPHLFLYEFFEYLELIANTESKRWRDGRHSYRA